MSSKTIYTCDHCKKEVDTNNMLTPIKLYIGNYTSAYTPDHLVEWCEDCLVKTGMRMWKNREVKPPVVEPTTEQLLMELLQNLIYEEVQTALNNRGV